MEAELNARAKTAADDRTFDQRKADAFVAQMRGMVAGQSISSRAVIGITIPCTSLAGLTDEPGTLLHRIITDPLGRILDITELGRFPSDKLRIAVDIRDGTCRFPTCSRPAMQRDLDHEVPHPRGPTTASNLRGLCRRHHNIKTVGIAEPTGFAMRTRTASRREHDLASFAVHMRWTYGTSRGRRRAGTTAD